MYKIKMCGNIYTHIRGEVGLAKPVLILSLN